MTSDQHESRREEVRSALEGVGVELTDYSPVGLEQGDVLVVRVDQALSQAQFALIKPRLDEVFAGQEMAVFHRDAVQLDVARPTAGDGRDASH
jgi:hypothetical protein